MSLFHSITRITAKTRAATGLFGSGIEGRSDEAWRVGAIARRLVSVTLDEEQLGRVPTSVRSIHTSH